MFWDINRAMRNAMASGERSRSNSSRPKGSLPSTCLQRPATTHLLSSHGSLTTSIVAFFLAVLSVCLATGAVAQQSQAPISPSGHPQAPPAPPAPPQAPQEGQYRIQTQVNLVVLHTSVLNDRSIFVPGLKQENFRVFEDKVEQKLSVFKQ